MNALDRFCSNLSTPVALTLTFAVFCLPAGIALARWLTD
jgi:hypothetical protein